MNKIITNIFKKKTTATGNAVTGTGAVLLVILASLESSGVVLPEISKEVMDLIYWAVEGVSIVMAVYGQYMVKKGAEKKG